MKKFKVIIIILVILILIIIGALLYIYLNKEEDKNIQINIEQIEENNNTIQPVTDISDFYRVSNSASVYFDRINKNNTSYYSTDESGKQVLSTDVNTIKGNIYNLLSESYIKENNVTKDNVFNYVENIDKKLIFVPLKMNVISNGNLEKYVIYGILEDTAYNFEKEIYLIVNLDKDNNTFAIEPILNRNISKIEDIKIEKLNEKIESNTQNKISNVNITDEYMCKDLLNTYKRLALSNPEIVYNNYFEKEYREKRFGSLENFKKYIEDNKTEIKALTMNKFLSDKDNNEYVCKDKNDCLYIFKTTSTIMNFTLKLDTYTILSDEYKEKYNSENDEGKVSLIIQNTIDMINNRDYHSLYGKLNETFKNTYFKTEEDLRKHMNAYFIRRYDFKITNLTKQGDIYVASVTTTERTTDSKKTPEEISLPIMVRIKEGFDYEISFYYNLEI